MRSLSFASLALLTASLSSAAPSATSTSLPTVDLGYQIHQAISFNETGQTYNFSNIRFAEPPVGELRFKAPVPPTGRNTTVQTGGQFSPICPQANPKWGTIGEEFEIAFIEGNGTAFNLAAAEAQLGAANAPAPSPQETEDCLFLDVFVPKKVFQNRNNAKAKKAAVLLWIYGGGYVLGSKAGDTGGNPSGLIAASQVGGGDGIIFIQINYRLGALGWLSGPTLEASGGVSNAGLYDQRLAIEWAAKYAHLFGGDGKNITIIGESAGGGSIVHQITAFGGQQGISFQGAIPQSPGWQPVLSAYKQENTTSNFLSLLNVSTIAEARTLSSKAVTSANLAQIYTSTYGEYTYGPAVDGVFVPANPGVLLAAGAFAKDVKVMAGHNTNEGVLFTNPSVRTDAQLTAFLTSTYPGIAPQIVSEIVNDLYPALYDGSMPYANALDRTIFVITEAIFTCNTNQLARALGNQSYAYQFEVPPALHGFDIGYTFWNGAPTNVATIPPLIAPLARVLQGYITNFAMTGDPNGKGLPTFPLYGSSALEVGLNVTVNTHMRDPTENPRCVFWGKAELN